VAGQIDWPGGEEEGGEEEEEEDVVKEGKNERHPVGRWARENRKPKKKICTYICRGRWPRNKRQIVFASQDFA